MRKVPLPTPGGTGKRFRNFVSEVVSQFVSVADYKQQRQRIQSQIGILKNGLTLINGRLIDEERKLAGEKANSAQLNRQRIAFGCGGVGFADRPF